MTDESQRLAGGLSIFASLFRICGALGAVGFVWLGFEDADRLVLYLIVAVAVLLQALWLAHISDAVKVLLNRLEPARPTDTSAPAVDAAAPGISEAEKARERAALARATREADRQTRIMMLVLLALVAVAVAVWLFLPAP